MGVGPFLNAGQIIPQFSPICAENAIMQKMELSTYLNSGRWLSGSTSEITPFSKAAGSA